MQIVTSLGWIRNGECNHCGKCCSMLGLHPTQKDKLKRLGWSEGRCRNLRGTNECKTYKDRPEFCHDFPAEPADIETTPECSFTFGAQIFRVASQIRLACLAMRDRKFE